MLTDDQKKQLAEAIPGPHRALAALMKAAINYGAAVDPDQVYDGTKVGAEDELINAALAFYEASDRLVE